MNSFEWRPPSASQLERVDGRDNFLFVPTPYEVTSHFIQMKNFTGCYTIENRGEVFTPLVVILDCR